MNDRKVMKWIKRIVVFTAVAGFVSCLISIYQKNESAEMVLRILGFSLFGLAFLVGIAGGLINSKNLIKRIKEEKNKQRERYEEDKSAWEEEAIEFINDTGYGEEHKKRIAVRWLFHLGNAKKNIKYFSNKSRILGGIMITICALLAISIVPLFAFGKTVAALIVLGSFFAIFIASAIINSIIEKKSISRGVKYKREIMNGKMSDCEEKAAKVIGCILSSESSFSSGGAANRYYNERTKILSTTYRVIVDVDGEEKTAFSKKFYNEGDIVRVVTKPNVKWASILQDKAMSTNVTITEASESDAELIWEMQKVAFADLLEKYEDYDTSPANETLDKVKSRFEDPYTYHYFIEAENQIVGALRIVDRKSEENKKLSQILILPEFRRKGYAYSAIRRAENIHGSTGWELDTILQEKSLRLMYESLGYRRTDYTRVVNYKMTLVGYKK